MTFSSRAASFVMVISRPSLPALLVAVLLATPLAARAQDTLAWRNYRPRPMPLATDSVSCMANVAAIAHDSSGRVQREVFTRCMHSNGWEVTRIVGDPHAIPCDPVGIDVLTGDTLLATDIRRAFERRFRPSELMAGEIRVELTATREGLTGAPAIDGKPSTPLAIVARAARDAVDQDLARRFRALPRDTAGVYAVTLRAQCVREFAYVVAAPSPAAGVTASGPPTYFEFQVEKPVRPKAGNAAPQYPQELIGDRIEGRVLVQFVVDEKGKPDMSSLKVLETSHSLFAQAVRDALPRMRYVPAEIAGVPVRQIVQQPFLFGLSY